MSKLLMNYDTDFVFMTATPILVSTPAGAKQGFLLQSKRHHLGKELRLMSRHTSLL